MYILFRCMYYVHALIMYKPWLYTHVYIHVYIYCTSEDERLVPSERRVENSTFKCLLNCIVYV